MKILKYVWLTAVLVGWGAGFSRANDLYVGTAVVDITPRLPAALDGQMNIRIANVAETPLLANILVLDSQEKGKSVNTTILVTCDLVAIPSELRDFIQQAAAKNLPGLDTKKIIINATHTHTGAVVRDGWYTIPKGVTQVSDFQQAIARKIGDAIAKAWNTKKQGRVSWGLNHAQVAYNRRAVYEDGHAQMYGKTNGSDFRKIEGPEDQSINSLFFWDEAGKLLAVGINVASPAQIAEGRSTVNADYWHPVRLALQKKYGNELAVLGLIGAAGDQSPRPMLEHAAEYRMTELYNRKAQAGAKPGKPEFGSNIYLDEIARRIVNAVSETHEAIKNERVKDVRINHEVVSFEVPARIVTAEEYASSKKLRDEDLNDPAKAVPFSRRIAWNNEVLERFEVQKTTPQPMYPIEMHVVRIGDVVLCTNPFELFTDFGIQIKARSKALQTFVVQLVGSGTYVPTKTAVAGGHYSAIVQSNRVGPEGGQVLVDRTVEAINRLWP